LDGDTEILPGIRCLLVPGHTVGLQAVEVATADGTAVLASDCAHFFRNFQEDWPSALIVDLVAWMESYEKLRNIVSDPDFLFPGHDPLLSTNYPQVAPGVTQLC
jgi:glyoxylase-like metal-dependent hydrolase (beta-lactamase superfamily II)